MATLTDRKKLNKQITSAPRHKIKAKTANHVLVISDAFADIHMTVAGANTLTIPPEATVNFKIGTVIDVTQMGAGQTTITPGASVTLRSNGAKYKTTAQYAVVKLVKIASNTWLVSGDAAA